MSKVQDEQAHSAPAAQQAVEAPCCAAGRDGIPDQPGDAVVAPPVTPPVGPLVAEPCCAAGRDGIDGNSAARPGALKTLRSVGGPGGTDGLGDLKNSGAIKGSGSVTTLARSGRDPREGMIALPGGEFLMGTDDQEGFPADGEGPVRAVRVRPFLIDPYVVTNAQFAEFVKATGYKTDAERFGWSYVFHHFVTPRGRTRRRGRNAQAPWWWGIDGAYWGKPDGPDSSIRERRDHPVVHISWDDAMAYCAWASKRLPTEAEWEFAARGGLEQARYPWGDEFTPDGRMMCNTWQGRFPDYNSAEDGYAGTAPVHAFEPNGYGLYNVSGNVWEWCHDWFSASHQATGLLENPTGPPDGTEKAIRGGSYLCHKSYCNRYRLAARSKNTVDSSTGNCGFRCAADA